MLRILAIALATLVLGFIQPAHAVSSCEWGPPGANPYTGSARSAIMAAKAMPWWARVILTARVEKAAPTDRVSIGKDYVAGQSGKYDSKLYDMNFGSSGHICNEVTRKTWGANDVQMADAWCIADWCSARPDICGNWVVIRKVKPARGALGTAPEPGGLALAGLGLLFVWKWGRIRRRGGHQAF